MLLIITLGVLELRTSLFLTLLFLSFFSHGNEEDQNISNNSGNIINNNSGEIVIKKIYTTEKKNSDSAFSILNEILSQDIFYSNINYLESIIGIAKNTHSYDENLKSNIYLVNGCEIEIEVSNETVLNLGISHLTEECTFDLSMFMHNHQDLPPLPQNITFGDFWFNVGPGKYSADCLMGCGNAADPSVYFTWSGSRADLGIEIQLGVILTSDAAIDSAFKWRDVMFAEKGEDYVIDGKFNCSYEYNSIAQKAFKNVKINSIKIGYGVKTERKDCS